MSIKKYAVNKSRPDTVKGVKYPGSVMYDEGVEILSRIAKKTVAPAKLKLNV